MLPDHRRLYVSGTASIEPSGKTAHIGDPAKQISLTMEVVAAILESRRMTWADVSRAIAYFKDIKDAPLFDEYCRMLIEKYGEDDLNHIINTMDEFFENCSAAFEVVPAELDSWLAKRSNRVH